MSKASQLSLASGVELKYRADMIGILRKEAQANELDIQMQPVSSARRTPSPRSTGASWTPP
jgi:hypothetical protein